MKERPDMMILLEKIAEADPRYKPDAYLFVLNGLNHTVSRFKKPRHVNGRELSEGLREYAIDQFGAMARTVLESWGVANTGDFGNIVFNLIEVKLLSKTDDDTIEDFDRVYDFSEAFRDSVNYKID